MALRSETALIKAQYETSLIQELLKLGAFIDSGEKERNNTHSEREKMMHMCCFSSFCFPIILLTRHINTSND